MDYGSHLRESNSPVPDYKTGAQPLGEDGLAGPERFERSKRGLESRGLPLAYGPMAQDI
jgi:hypothetical protein